MDDKYFKPEYVSPMTPMTDAEIKAIIEKEGDCKINVEYLTVHDFIDRYKDILTEEQIKKLKYETLGKN